MVYGGYPRRFDQPRARLSLRAPILKGFHVKQPTLPNKLHVERVGRDSEITFPTGTKVRIPDSTLPVLLAHRETLDREIRHLTRQRSSVQAEIDLLHLAVEQGESE